VKDIVCGDDSSDYDDLNHFAESGKNPCFGYPLPLQFTPDKLDQVVSKYGP